MKDTELKLEDVESPYTLGGGNLIQFGYSSLTETITNGPVCMCDRGAWERGGCGLASVIFCLPLVFLSLE